MSYMVICAHTKRFSANSLLLVPFLRYLCQFEESYYLEIKDQQERDGIGQKNVKFKKRAIKADMNSQS